MAQDAPLDLYFVYESYSTPFGSWSLLEPQSSGRRGALHHLAGARAADAAEDAIDTYSIGGEQPPHGPDSPLPSSGKPSRRGEKLRLAEQEIRAFAKDLGAGAKATLVRAAARTR